MVEKRASVSAHKIESSKKRYYPLVLSKDRFQRQKYDTHRQRQLKEQYNYSEDQNDSSKQTHAFGGINDKGGGSVGSGGTFFNVSSSYDRWNEYKSNNNQSFPPSFVGYQNYYKWSDNNNGNLSLSSERRHRHIPHRDGDGNGNNDDGSSYDVVTLPIEAIGQRAFQWMNSLCSNDSTITAAHNNTAYIDEDENEGYYGNNDDVDEDYLENEEETRIFTELVNYSMELTNQCAEIEQRVNQNFDERFNQSNTYVNKLTQYYSSNPELFQYTMEKELPRMSYKVITTCPRNKNTNDDDNCSKNSTTDEENENKNKSRGILLETTEEIRNSMLKIVAPKQSSSQPTAGSINDDSGKIMNAPVEVVVKKLEKASIASFSDDDENDEDDENDKIHTCIVDDNNPGNQLHKELLWRAANQSLFADVLSTLISFDGVVRPQHMSTIFVQNANFLVDTVSNYIQCQAIMRVSIPSPSIQFFDKSNPLESNNSNEDGKILSTPQDVIRTISTPDEKLNLATFQLNIHYSPSVLSSMTSKKKEIINNANDQGKQREGRFKCSLTNFIPSPLVQTNSNQFFQCLHALAKERYSLSLQ